jgi:hypothetical protein
MPAQGPRAVPDEAEGLFDDAARIASSRHRWFGELRIWLTGAEVDVAWKKVHAAEALIVLMEGDEAVLARIPTLSEAVRDRLPAGDARAAPYLKTLSDLSAKSASRQVDVTHADDVTTGDRERIRAIKETLNEITDEAHARLRSFRNVALGVTVALTVVAVVLGFDPPGDEWLPVCAPADSSGAMPACATVWQIEAVGALGGLLAVVTALVAFQGFSGPYALPAVMAVLKVPAGALTGLLGAIWMQSEVFGFKAQAGGKILAFVALFGFAQQAITAFADRQAGQLLGQAQGGKP